MVTQKGFSLVELLIALVILSGVTVLSGSAFSLFMQQWDGMRNQYDNDVKELRFSLAVYDALAHIHPLVVQGDERSYFYFEGNRNGLVAYTNRGLQHPDKPAIVRFKVEQDANFKFSLVYEEATLIEEIYRRIDSPLVFRSPIVIASELDEIEFSYYGEVSAITDQEDIEKSLQWLSEYNSLALTFYPRKVNVTYTKQRNPISYTIDLVQPSPAQQSRLSAGAIDKDIGF